MGAELPEGGAFVLLHHVHVVEMGQPLERIDCNQDVPGVRVYLVKAVPAGKVMQDSRFMEVSELRHVVHSCWGRFRVFGVYAREAGHNRFAVGGGDGDVGALDPGDLAVDPGLVGILQPDLRADDDVDRSPHVDRFSPRTTNSAQLDRRRRRISAHASTGSNQPNNTPAASKIPRAGVVVAGMRTRE